ncbi:MAG: hypothetical protein RL145_1343, partial [Pseudomonadota bacterium]
MIDPRFYRLLGPKTLAELAQVVKAELPAGFDPDLPLTSCAPLDQAQASDLAFCQGPAKGKSTIETGAGACLVRAEHAAMLPPGVAPLIVKEPRAVFAA